MKDYIRENLSYPGLLIRKALIPKEVEPECYHYGSDKEQYFLYYEPVTENISDKIIFWIHGGGWNAGSPNAFDYVGQCMAKEGYRIVSFGYRLSPKHKYPCQIKDVCECFNVATHYLKEKGIDTSKIIVAGPSAGAHLASILCYSRKVQERFGVEMDDVIGFIGSGGPYSFRENQSWTIRSLEAMLFKKDYDRRNGEPVKLMSQSHIPMLLIQSRHDGLINFECAEDFAERAKIVGNECEIYSVIDKRNTHSWYTAGMFMMSREDNAGLNKFFTWIEAL